MTTVHREIMPYALAIALTPFGVTVAILLLFTPRPRQSAGAVLSGWTVGIAGASGVSVAPRRSSTSATSLPSRLPWVGGSPSGGVRAPLAQRRTARRMT
jgi:F0F1-type ATP synthase membrane subunit c/vacuolar-type H+-ATPase subunit K